MKRMKFWLGLPVVLMLMLAMVGLVSAAGSFIAPTTSGTVRGSYTFNLTVTSLDPVQGLMNCSVSGSSAVNSDTWTFTLQNQSGGGNSTHAYASGAQASGAEKDAADWTFSATCYNATTQESGNSTTVTAITTVIVDNTAPTITGCTVDGNTASNTTIEDSDATVACTVRNATACNLYWKTTTARPTGTDYSDSDCTLTATSSYVAAGTSASCNLFQIGNDAHNWYYDCTDGTNTTTLVTYTLSMVGESHHQELVDGSIGDGLGGVGSLGDNMMLLLLIGGVVILIGAGMFLLNNKK